MYRWRPSVGQSIACDVYDDHHIEDRTRQPPRLPSDVSRWVRVRCFSAASRSASESRGSSTARASTSAPTIVATVTSARSCAPRLPPVGRLPGDEVDHFLDAARGGAPHLRRLAWHLRAERGNRAARLHSLDVRLRRDRPAASPAAPAAVARRRRRAPPLPRRRLPARSAASASIASREGKWA